MVPAIIFAQLWGVIQLIVLTSLARTVRVRTVFAAMAVGFYLIGPLTAFIQLSWIHIAARLIHDHRRTDIDVTRMQLRITRQRIRHRAVPRNSAVQQVRARSPFQQAAIRKRRTHHPRAGNAREHTLRRADIAVRAIRLKIFEKVHGCMCLPAYA